MPLNSLIFNYPSANALQLKLTGDWRISAGLPEEKDFLSQLESNKSISEVSFNLTAVTKWDSGLVSFLLSIIRECEHKSIKVNRQGLPEGIDKLLALALKSSDKNIPQNIEHLPFLDRVGNKVLYLLGQLNKILSFLGEIAYGFGRLITGKAYFRGDEFSVIVKRCGADALALVSLISLLVGMNLAFVGAIQLRLFGAQIYIADIVGVGMVRVMGAVLVGIIMSGRTGASFAAELGLMQINEEIDALKTLGIPPVEFLVVPRILALVIMMPLLTLYADFMGVLGGFIISTTFLGLNPMEYWSHTQLAVHMSNVWIGLAHGFIFSIVVAIAGCLCGMETERSAEGIGVATTSAVVNGITSIVISTAVITLSCRVLGV